MVPLAVLFDFHDTLVHLHPTTEGAVAAELGVELDAYRDAWREVEQELERRRGEGTWPPPVADRWDLLYALLFEALGLAGDPAPTVDRLVELFRSPGSYRAFPDAAPVLAELARRGLRLGVVSNSDFDLWPVLEHLGLAGSLSAAYPVLAHGTEKPDPAAFALAVAELGVEPPDCWFVGDHVDEDAVASDALGMHAILVDREGRQRLRPGAERFRVVDDLRPLPALLDEAGRGPAPARYLPW
ncbi:MAG: HAD family hydrolase [Acidimicrobiia bacterium]|nr:HAD family hydrolase [Acidimicrobiia bacterium]